MIRFQLIQIVSVSSLERLHLVHCNRNCSKLFKVFPMINKLFTRNEEKNQNFLKSLNSVYQKRKEFLAG